MHPNDEADWEFWWPSKKFVYQGWTWSFEHCLRYPSKALKDIADAMREAPSVPISVQWIPEDDISDIDKMCVDPNLLSWDAAKDN